MSTEAEEDAIEALCAHNLKLLETGDLSDCSVVCGDRTWKAHKIILCRVEYFDKLITSGFKELQENQINIPNFRPFEIDLLLRYIYHPRVDVEAACLQGPIQSFLELCVRLWQLGDCYGIETLAASAQAQMQKRVHRYIAEAGHVADMMKDVPFVFDLECAIRAAWDPKKAPGPHRKLLLSLCQALAPYISEYSEIPALFDEIPELASEFSKTVLGCGSIFSRGSQLCATCDDDFSIRNALSNERDIIFHPVVGIRTALEDDSEKWYCSRGCHEQAFPLLRVNHDDCEICKRQWPME